MSFPFVAVTLIRSVERGTTLHAPGTELRVPYDEAASLIRLGFAIARALPPLPEEPHPGRRFWPDLWQRLTLR